MSEPWLPASKWLDALNATDKPRWRMLADDDLGIISWLEDEDGTILGTGSPARYFSA